MWFLPEIADEKTGWFILMCFFVGLLATSLFMFYLMGIGHTLYAWFKGEDWRAVREMYRREI